MSILSLTAFLAQRYWDVGLHRMLNKVGAIFQEIKKQEYLTGSEERRGQEDALGWIVPVIPSHPDDVASQELHNKISSLGK